MTLTEVAAQIAAVQFRATSFAFYFDDVWKVTPKLTISVGLRYENTPPWTDISGNLTTVYFNAFDNTPNVADQSRYPVFLRQGKGSGDPYAGLRVQMAQYSAGAGWTPGRHAWCNRDNNDFAPRLGIRLESHIRNGRSAPERDVLQPGPRQPAVRRRAKRGRPNAE